MGLKVVTASAANFSFLAKPYRSFETPVNFGSLEYCGIFISLSPILLPWGLRQPQFQGSPFS